jgi:protein O-mannosyl-transferase
MAKARKKLIRQRLPVTAAATATNRVQRWWVPGVCLVLGAMTFAVFGQTLQHKFIDFDDDVYVYNNPMVVPGLTFNGVVQAFIRFHADNWHPLTWLSHMLDCQLYGLQPGGHHLTNVLLHTATAILLFLVLRQMTGFLWRSAFVAAVFAIHPLRVESVAWVAERKDVLSGLFFMLAIGAYVRYARLPWSPRRYGLVMLLFALGLMCKPMLVTLPLVLLLLDLWPLQRKESAGRLVLEKLPLLALSAASCGVTILAQNEAIQSSGHYLLPLRLANALVSCMVYLGQMVYPAGLAAFYPYPQNGLPPWEAGLAGILVAGFSTVAWLRRRTQPWLLVGWLWYLVMLLPVAGIFQVGGQAHADRYTYLPQIGIYVAVTWLAAEWSARWQVGRAAVGWLMTLVLGALMICAWKQTAYWQDSETLWTRTLGCTTRNAVAHYNLAVFLDQNGRPVEAISHFQTALQINPNDAEARNNLGSAFLETGNLDDAIAQYQEALRINPRHANVHSNLGAALWQKGRTDEAISHFQEAVQIVPDNASYRFNLAKALQQQGRVAEAITQYQMELQLQPADVEAQNNLASLLARPPAGTAAPR